MISGEHQGLLAEHGLTEDERGYGLTLRGPPEGATEGGSAECCEILGLDAGDERRARLSLHLRIEVFSVAYSNNSRGF